MVCLVGYRFVSFYWWHCFFLSVSLLFHGLEIFNRAGAFVLFLGHFSGDSKPCSASCTTIIAFPGVSLLA